MLEGALREMEVKEEERQREHQERQERERQKYQRLNDAFEQARVEANRPPRRSLYNIEEEEDTEDELLVGLSPVTEEREKQNLLPPDKHLLLMCHHRELLSPRIEALGEKEPQELLFQTHKLNHKKKKLQHKEQQD